MTDQTTLFSRVRLDRRQLVAAGAIPLSAGLGLWPNHLTSAAQSGEPLRYADSYGPSNVDVLQGGTAFYLITAATAETLMRITPELALEPWLAEFVEPVDDRTWRVRLRSGITFHDGSAVNAAAVVTSFAQCWESLPDAANILPVETTVTAVDDLTLEFITPEPVGGFLNALASRFFPVQKPGADDVSLLTGPYRTASFVPDERWELVRYDEYWGGMPPLPGISFRNVVDSATRALALQTDEVDLVANLGAEVVGTIPEPFITEVATSTRIQWLLINTQRPGFDDVDVRRAIAMALDRDALNAAGFFGLATPVTGLYSPTLELPVIPAATPVATVAGPDLTGARQLLADGGWAAGTDGTLERDGVRLEGVIASYASRADLTPMATVIQGTLSELGITIEIQEVEDIYEFLGEGEWAFSVYSYNTLVTADPGYVITTFLTTDAPENHMGYSSLEMDAIGTAVRVETDPTARLRLGAEAQALALAEVPAISLVLVPRIVAWNPERVTAVTPHPIDIYLLNATTSGGSGV